MVLTIGGDSPLHPVIEWEVLHPDLQAFDSPNLVPMIRSLLALQRDPALPLLVERLVANMRGTILEIF